MRFKSSLSIVILIITMIMCLSGCTGQNSTDRNSNNITPDTEQIDNKTFEWYYTMDAFNSGLACVSGSIDSTDEDKDSLYGFIDKNGDMIFKISNSISIFGEQFENGFLYIQDTGTLYVVDTEGTIRSKHSQYQKVSAGGNSYYIYGDEENTVCSYSYGFVVNQEHIKDFNTNKYKYTLYSPDGDVLFEYEIGDKNAIDIYHAGCGVYAFSVATDDVEQTILYLPEVNDTLTIESNSTIEFINGYAITDDYNIIDTKGNITEINFRKYNDKIEEYCNNYGFDTFGHDVSYVYEDYILCYTKSMYNDWENDTKYYYPWFSYNYVTNEIYEYNNQEILSKIDWELMEYDYGLGFQEGKLILPLKGADKETYFTILDTQMEEVLSPTKVDSLDVNVRSGLIAASANNDTLYYKLDGTVSFKLSDTGYKNKFDFSEGAMLVYTKGSIDSDCIDSYFGEEFAYIDTNGNVLFTQVDKTTAKELVLN